jgi:hypothetical protein
MFGDVFSQFYVQYCFGFYAGPFPSGLVPVLFSVVLCPIVVLFWTCFGPSSGSVLVLLWIRTCPVLILFWSCLVSLWSCSGFVWPISDPVQVRYGPVLVRSGPIYCGPCMTLLKKFLLHITSFSAL